MFFISFTINTFHYLSSLSICSYLHLSYPLYLVVFSYFFIAFVFLSITSIVIYFTFFSHFIHCTFFILLFCTLIDFSTECHWFIWFFCCLMELLMYCKFMTAFIGFVGLFCSIVKMQSFFNFLMSCWIFVDMLVFLFPFGYIDWHYVAIASYYCPWLYYVRYYWYDKTFAFIFFLFPNNFFVTIPYHVVSPSISQVIFSFYFLKFVVYINLLM